MVNPIEEIVEILVRATSEGKIMWFEQSKVVDRHILLARFAHRDDLSTGMMVQVENSELTLCHIPSPPRPTFHTALSDEDAAELRQTIVPMASWDSALFFPTWKRENELSFPIPQCTDNLREMVAEVLRNSFSRPLTDQELRSRYSPRGGPVESWGMIEW